MKGVNYSNPGTPLDYKCSNCGATGVKLWREYMDFGPTQSLCFICTAKVAGKVILSVSKEGMVLVKDSHIGEADSIGWFTPAIPDEEGVGYWGRGAVPEAGIKWWQNLPIIIG
jgi:hypothetical protein